MCVHGRVLLLLLFLERFGVRTPLYDKKKWILNKLKVFY